MQKISLNAEPANDMFLTAIEKIRKEQETKAKDEQRR